MIFSNEFEEKKEKINKICKDLKDKDDRIIVKTLYDVSNIQETQKGDNLQERLSKTPFTNESMINFLKHFSKEDFSKYSGTELEYLFQELHNRECKRSEIEPRYIVSVKNKGDMSNGYMVPGTNELNINAGVIDKYRRVESTNNHGKNANTIGAHSALTLIHETQHTVQMEGIMNFALNKEQNKEDRARDAIFFLDTIITDYAYEKGDTELQMFIRNAYWFNYMEHKSNMAPVTFIMKQIKDGTITDKAFLDALAYRTTNDIHIKEQPTEKRVLDMEKILVKYTNIVKTQFKDGPLKSELLSVLDEHLKVGENGNSPFRTSMTNDFNMAKEMIKYCEKNTNKVKNINQKVKIDNINEIDDTLCYIE